MRYSGLLQIGCGLLSLCAIVSCVGCRLPSLCATVSCWLLTALTMRYGEYIMLVADCRHCALQWVVANWLWTALTMRYSELWYSYLLCTTACPLLYKVVGKLTTRPGGGAGHTAC